MRGWRARWGRIVIVTATAALCSCSMNLERRETSLSNDELKASLERTMQRSRKSVNDRIARQRISPQEEAAARQADRSLELLEPGAPIWVQSGKSRVLHLPRPRK